MNNEEQILLSILFLKGNSGYDIKEISSLIKKTQTKTKDLIEDLTKTLDKLSLPLTIKFSNEKIRLTITNKASSLLSDKLDKTINIRLSKSVIETLTIIAYQQPITKPEIERVRGVSSDYAIAKLLQFEIIEDAGRSELPGQPYLYVTTRKFLEIFDLESINSLPPMPEDLDLEEKTSESLLDYE